MIEVGISQARADELLRDGVRAVMDPRGTHRREPVFMFTGPGMYLAEIAYGEALPSDTRALYDGSLWDVAILYVEQKPDGL